MGEHEHDFRELVIERFPGGGMPSWEWIAGYRCACGERASYRGTEAERRRLFDPLYNAQTALRLYRAAQAGRALQPWYGSRYAAKRWRDYLAETNEEAQMQDQTTLRAPDNPYRRDEGRAVDIGLVGYGGAGDDERALDQTGPGLTAADLDDIVRSHWRAGKVRAEWLASEREEVMRERHRGELADAFDEGYTAGRAQVAQGLAREFGRPLVAVHFALMQIEASNSQERAKLLPGLRAQIDELVKLAETLARSEEAAAAQVARDEAVGS
jgi:hypothetical protein